MASLSESGARILVTGARGFTGRYVVQSLRAEGYEVCELHYAGRSVDIRDAAAVRQAIEEIRPDKVIHLAAIAFVSHGDVDEIYRVNIIGARNLLAALAGLSQKPSSVILASSANIYGNAYGILDESVSPSPQNDYAVSKVAMEYVANLWSGALPITVVRPFNYTGIGQSEKYLIPKIVSHFRSRAEIIELGNLDVERDFYDVRLVAQTYVKLLQASVAAGTFNICSGQGHTLESVIATLERLTGHRIEVRVNPAFVRANEVKRLVGSRERLNSVIGPPPRFSFEATLLWMLGSGSRSGLEEAIRG